MKKIFKKGDIVTLFSCLELYEILKKANFCPNDITRYEVAKSIGGKTGLVSSIEEKYVHDHFYFLPDSNEMNSTYVIPYEAIKQ